MAGAWPKLRKSLQFAQQLGDEANVAYAVEVEATAAPLSSDWATAATRIPDALAMRRALGNRFSVIMLLERAALAAHMMGDSARARAYHAEALASRERAQRRELGPSRAPLD
jgi:hypothetical protein